jgi:hypothetical protein
MSGRMAVSTKSTAKQSPGKGKSKARAAAGKLGRQPTGKPKAGDDDGAEPDRSSPALAEVDAEVLEFIAALDRFKKDHSRPFPSWSEVLLVVRQLGYKR